MTFPKTMAKVSGPWKALLRKKGHDISWHDALSLTALWFVFVTLLEVALILVLLLFALLQVIDNFGVVIIGAWIVVLGHAAVILVAVVRYRSWKLSFLYAVIPMLLGTVLYLWVSAGLRHAAAM